MCTTLNTEIPTAIFFPQPGNFGGSGTLPMIKIPQQKWHCPTCPVTTEGNADGKTCYLCGSQMVSDT